MTSPNTIAFGADTLDVDSVKVPGTMLVVRRALLAYEKKMQPGDHLVVPRTISAEWPKANKRHRLPTQ